MKLLPCTLLPLVSARVIADHRYQAPIVSEKSGESSVAPGIGIHLTTSYATAAIRYENGTVENIVRVQGTSEYIDVISRLAHATGPPKCVHKLEELMSLECYVAHKIRQLRKWFGWSATADIGILSSILRKVKTAAEDKLGHDIRSVWPAFPYIEMMDEDDVRDTLEHAGLEWSPTGHVYWETNAAYAGLGYGLCEPVNDGSRCKNNEGPAHTERVLILNFDNSSFSASTHWMQTAYNPWPHSYELNLDLGWWNLPVYEIPRAKFWAQMHEIIVKVASSEARAPNKIVLIGDHSCDKEFHETIKAALWELLEFDVEMLLSANEDVDGSTLAARGAAELAFRAQQKSSSKEIAEDEYEAVEL